MGEFWQNTETRIYGIKPPSLQLLLSRSRYIIRQNTIATYFQFRRKSIAKISIRWPTFLNNLYREQAIYYPIMTHLRDRHELRLHKTCNIRFSPLSILKSTTRYSNGYTRFRQVITSIRFGRYKRRAIKVYNYTFILIQLSRNWLFIVFSFPFRKL